MYLYETRMSRTGEERYRIRTTKSWTCSGSLKSRDDAYEADEATPASEDAKDYG
jgi:hypothetical protein